MTEIRKAGESNSLGDLDVPQGEFREQIDALTDAVRQLGGNPEIAPGPSVVNDPLNAPYVLYVNSYTGRDTFVAGDYAFADDGAFETKMRRISNQRLECGYTEARPFKTINRAIIEAGIITSRDYLDITPAPCGDLVSIVLAPGAHTCFNGTSSRVVDAWADGYEPGKAELQAFNPSDVGGVILPRGCSLISLDLRKTIVRPDFVPVPRNEGPDFSRRRAMFRLTGGCYVYGMTFMDQVGLEQSHHLLDVFQYASKAQLDEFYSTIRKAFGPATGVDPKFAVSRSNEYQIVGPQPNVPTNATDTVGSASPYIYNVSNRSTYGLGGLFADGDAVDGFKSVVIAQYTGVSLQRDMTSWEIYNNLTKRWEDTPTYEQYINADPNDLRHKPERRSYHIRAVNKAVIQEVSVFAIGQAIHHAVESGGEITVTNSNSNWGGCASLATGYRDEATLLDKGHTAKQVLVPADPLTDATVRKIQLGVLADGQNPATLQLKFDEAGVSTLFLDAGYTLPVNDLIWVTNPFGPDYFGYVDSYDFTSDTASITIQAPLINEEQESPVVDPDGLIATPDPLAGQIVYIRRLQDNRSLSDRTYRVLIDSNTTSRRPVRDYIPVEDKGALPTDEIATVLTAGGPEGEDADSIIQLRYAKRSDIGHEASKWYWPGDTVTYQNKHYTAIKRTTGAFDPDDWDESFVHMQEDFAPEGYYKNVAPIVIIDGDTDPDPREDSEDLGVTSLPASSQAQIEGAIDYIGTRIFLDQLGISDSLDPVGRSSRYIDVDKNINFHRPSNIRLYSHAFEWAGFQNYSKAVPKYQLLLSRTNKFTYYFTNEAGGRVYCSGFNEEGAGVTNAGIQDFETGASISFDAIGNAAIPASELNTSNLPKAGKNSPAGVVKVAIPDEVDNVLKGTTDTIGSSTEGYHVVDVNDLSKVKSYVDSSIEATTKDLKILPDEESVVYVHSSVVRKPGSTESQGNKVPAIVNEWDAHYQTVHGGPADKVKDSDGNDLCKKLSFRSMGQALEWLAGRSPVGRAGTTVVLLDETIQDRDYVFQHTASKQLTIRGPKNRSNPLNPDNYVGHLDNRITSIPDAGKLIFMDVTISISEYSKTEFWTLLLESDLKLNNCTIRGRSNQEFMGFMAKDIVKTVEFEYDRLWKSTIKFDIASTGTDYDARRGHTDIRIGNLIIQSRIRSMATQAEADAIEANELIFKLSRKVNRKPILIEFWNSFMRIGRSRPEQTNHKLKWTFDFRGNEANRFKLVGPVTKGHFQATPNLPGFDGGEFTCEVVNRGDVGKDRPEGDGFAEIMTCKSYIETMQLGTLFDEATFSAGYGSSTATISGIIGDAFTAAGVSKQKVYVPLASNTLHPEANNFGGSLLPYNNVLNNTWYALDGATVPNPRSANPTVITEEEIRELGGSVDETKYQTEEDYDPL